MQKLCPDGVEYRRLGDKDVSIMQRGTSLTKNNSKEGIYPVISGGRIPAFYCDKFNREGETITVAGSGAGAGYVQYWNEPIFVCDAFSIKGCKEVSTKYLYYCLTNLQDKIYATKKRRRCTSCSYFKYRKFSYSNSTYRYSRRNCKYSRPLCRIANGTASGTASKTRAI